MAAIIDNQYIVKRGTNRHKSSSSARYSGFNYKSAGFDTGFMEHFNQKLVHSRYRKNSGKKPFLVRKPDTRITRQEKQRGSGFSFSVPSPMTVAVVAGIVLIALLALKWEEINFKVPEEHIFTNAGNQNTDEIALGYAKTGVTNIAPQLTKTPEKDSVEVHEAETDETAPNLIVTFQWQEYKVTKGEVVSTIAKKFAVSMDAIIASNDIKNVRKLPEGAVLRIPNIDGIPYQVKKGDSLSKISAAYNVPMDVICDINDLETDIIKEGEKLFIPGARMNDIDLKKSLGELCIYPIQSREITSYYGMRKYPFTGALSFHTGIDIKANTGAPVKAAMDGTVAVVNNNWLYGQHILISHTNGYKTLYAHLSATSVKEGEKVAQGKKIGEVGSTGQSTGPHLHFGVYDKNGKLLNPLDLLN